MAKLILVRHGTTDWNKEGRWHGWTDISINDEGHDQARQAGEAIRDIQIDAAFTSDLARTQETYAEIKDVLALECPMTSNQALNERDYGDYTGKNKWEVQKEIGDDAFQQLRRSWDFQVPNGESMKQVSERLMPYYEQVILPLLKEGKNVLIVSSGNTLRTLIKNLKQMTDEEIANFSLNFGEIRVYDINAQGEVVNEEIRAQDLFKGKQ